MSGCPYLSEVSLCLKCRHVRTKCLNSEVSLYFRNSIMNTTVVGHTLNRTHAIMNTTVVGHGHMHEHNYSRTWTHAIMNTTIVGHGHMQ